MQEVSASSPTNWSGHKLREELRLGDDPITMRQEVDEHLIHLAPERDGGPRRCSS